ncbi:GH92 family glycosyl hydrolase [Occultella gossypii]|uniref:GH92 family glycosyl hydrolase n=1 Tax=Occultella gossypii TaxID=2800820 RepID=UPI001CBF8CD8|nr:GH92 family glycosyl hydrolase [Occultella gossypii]
MPDTSFRTSFEIGDPLPTAAAPLGWSIDVAGGPAHVPAGPPNVGLTGRRSLRVRSGAPGRVVLLDGLDVPVSSGTDLSYAVVPVLDPEHTYRATWTALDCRFDDGTWLSDLEAVDQYGAPATASGQGGARFLVPDHWNLVRIGLDIAAGRRIDAVAVVVAGPPDVGPGPAEVWFDDVSVGPRPAPSTPTGLADLVDTRRGTHSSGAYSRGNTVPAAALPNGFGFLVPLTDATSHRWMYSWAAHNGEDNLPRLEAVGLSHIPSPWMGDRNQLAIQLAGDGGDTPDASLPGRGLAFDHATEEAHPHRYGVALERGHRVDMTPTDHGGVIRLTFPPGASTGHVLVDAVSTEGAGPDGPCDVRIDGDGRLVGWVDHGSALSVGRSRMFVVGRLDRPVLRHGAADGDRRHARYATVDLGTGSSVEVRLATSFVSTAQAWHTYDLELAGRTFEQVEDAAREAWQERLRVLEVADASAEETATLYGNLYRLNLYPSSQWENAGTADAPEPIHASPVLEAGPSTADRTGAPVRPGEIYVNHGFWDTYRTCWPAYALLYPHLAGRLADGFVQQYREGGWIARWSSPGYADLMTGTSSDVAFADLFLRGVALPDPAGTYAAGLRNATAAPGPDGAGRKALAHATYRGWVPDEVAESVSWSLEGYINDAALAAMARGLAADAEGAERRRLLDEAAYLDQRASGYLHLYDAETGFFRGRGRGGAFAADFDPDSWGGDYTESNAWNFAFHVPHDGAALARLHGGPDGLEQLLERFFARPERADRPGTYTSIIHEMVEARDVRMGQLGMSNQVSHHIPYTWLAAGRPDRAQETVRTILARLWTGNTIGQGYLGDEDNGEMSAWWLLSALGLYPLEIGSSRWAVGSPLFPRAVVHRPGGDLVVEAPGNSATTPYVHGVTVGGRALAAPVVEHADLEGTATLRFEVSDEPGAWGRDAARTFPGERPRPWCDVSGGGRWQAAGRRAGPDLTALADDDHADAVDLPPGALEWRPGEHASAGDLVAYTLTSALDGRDAPSAWRVEVLLGDAWTVVDERSSERFPWPGQLRPFALAEPIPVGPLRLVLLEAGVLAEIELLIR